MTERFYVQFDGGWFETTAVWNDIGRPVGIFEELRVRKPGGVLVYPDAEGHQGHIGIILDDHRVVHCSKGNDQHFGDAIQATASDVFDANPSTRIGWLIGLHSIV